MLAMSWLVPLAISLFTFGSGFGLGYSLGDHNRNNAWLAKQAKVERDAHAKYEAEVVRGDTAVSNLITERQAMQGNFQKLTEKFNGLSKRVPIVVGADAAGGLRVHNYCDARAGDAGAKAIPDTRINDSVADSGGVLTAGAVWMWNSALAGQDQPAGACGLADTSDAACAAATTITLDDAWANHQANAEACAANRLAHERLIDFLKQREGAKP